MALEPANTASLLTRLVKEAGHSLAIDITKRAMIAVGSLVVAGAAFVCLKVGYIKTWKVLVLLLVVVALLLVWRSRSVRAVERDRDDKIRTLEAERDDKIRALEAERDDLDETVDVFNYGLVRHEAYQEHIERALDTLQKVVAGDIKLPIPKYVETGILEPARDLITEKTAEHVRLSVLMPRGKDHERWCMPFAAGHSVEGKAKYSERIVDTLARHAYETGEAQSWEDVTTDSGFKQHALATHPLRSMISLPLRWGDRIVGVFNAISSEPNAFDPAEQKYIDSLCSVVSVAVGVQLDRERAKGSEGAFG
jgi:GAF domain-containing protein